LSLTQSTRGNEARLNCTIFSGVGRPKSGNPEEKRMPEAGRHAVALVEDDDAVRDSLRFVLELAGYVVEAFATGAEFLKAEMGHIACLILDHHMPNMTGLELVEHLRANGIALPILLVTGDLSPAIATRAAGLGVNSVLTKPVNEQDLLDFIDAAML
jgi:two-component system, LuxR family, response regulator FixJ